VEVVSRRLGLGLPALMGAMCAAVTLQFAKSAGALEPEGIPAADRSVLRSPDLLDDLQVVGRTKATTQ
jgi:hypothetical protein